MGLEGRKGGIERNISCGGAGRRRTGRTGRGKTVESTSNHSGVGPGGAGSEDVIVLRLTWRGRGGWVRQSTVGGTTEERVGGVPLAEAGRKRLPLTVRTMA